LGFSIDLLRRPYNTLALPCVCVIKSLGKSAWSIIIPTNINDLSNVQINGKANQQSINLVSWKTPFTQIRGGGQSFSLGEHCPLCPSLATGLCIVLSGG